MVKKICPVCNKKSGNLKMHLKSHNKPMNIVAPKIGAQEIQTEGFANQSSIQQSSSFDGSGYATKEDLNELKGLLTQLLQQKQEVKKIDDKTEKESEEPDINPVSPKYRALVDEILGKDFGVNVVYPDTGTGFLFKVIVPLDKSNAVPSHKEFYKCDIRTKAIGYQEGLEGIRRFLEKVAKNLKVKK